MTTTNYTYDDLYNFVMFGLEPELMTAVIPHLDALYADETQEESTARLSRYQAALNECQDILDTYELQHEQLIQRDETAALVAAGITKLKANIPTNA